MLRECKQVPPFSRISYFRGRIWEQKGEPKTAAIFLKHAVDLAPTNASYWAAWMDALRTADPKTARKIADGWLSDYENSSPFVVVNACQLKFQSTLEMNDEVQALPIYKQIVQALDSANKKLFDANKPLWEYQPFFGLSFSLLATCLEHLGHLPGAYYYYTWAIGLGPTSALLTARGKMLYGIVSQVSQSLIDFRDAIKLGTDIAVPYFFLAHYAIATGDFEEALKMANEGLRRKWTKRMMSELYELRAIADYHLLASHAKVRKSFQDAIRTDVTNERAAKNLAKFEELIQKNERPAGQPWTLPMVDDVKRLARDVQFAARYLVEA
jgi:tetratricopeptide (TPR) repeat protein